MLNNIVILKSRLGVTEGHWKWHHSKTSARFPIRLSTVTIMAVSCIVSEIKQYCSKIVILSYPLRGGSRNLR